MPEDQLWQYPRLRIELENYFFGNISHQPLVVAPKKNEYSWIWSCSDGFPEMTRSDKTPKSDDTEKNRGQPCSKYFRWWFFFCREIWNDVGCILPPALKNQHFFRSWLFEPNFFFLELRLFSSVFTPGRIARVSFILYKYADAEWLLINRVSVFIIAPRRKPIGKS